MTLNTIAKGNMKMSNNNSVSFGSTRILYSANKKPINFYIDKIMKYPNRSFWEVKGFGTAEQANKGLKAGQVGVVAEKDALVIKGHDNIDDELIYKIVTDFGKSKEKGISFVQDSLNIIG